MLQKSLLLACNLADEQACTQSPEGLPEICYFTKTSIQEDMQEVYTFLNEKIEAFLKLDEATLLQKSLSCRFPPFLQSRVGISLQKEGDFFLHDSRAQLPDLSLFKK